MKLPHLIFLLLFGFFANLHSEERTAEELFFAGNIRAAEEAYTEAISLYEMALKQRPSPNLHYNLGNAYHHLEDWGKARIHWEKALAMDPGHTAARTNLELLLSDLDLATVESTFPEPLAQIFSYHQWTWIAALSVWLILFSLLARRWKPTAWLYIPAGLGATALLLAVTVIIVLNPTRDHAIILADNTALRVAPAPKSPTVATLKPAQRVHILDTYNTFLHVSLPTGQQGYLQPEELERIW